MKAYSECYPNQLKKIVSNCHRHPAIGEILKISEKF